MRLSIIIPTCGRLTLRQTLASLRAQPLQPDDEVIVAGGPKAALALATTYGARVIATSPGRDWGCRERTVAIGQAQGTHLAFIDDDDTWVPGARAAIADAMCQTPDCPVLFKMRYRRGGILWDAPALTSGNVSSQMILIPNDPARLGRWTRRREGDYDFLVSMRWPASDIVWRPEVIAQIR